VGPGGVGLPDRIIMFLKMQIQKKKRNTYHVAKMLGFLGEKPAEAKIHGTDFSMKSKCQNQV
jgi:endothelin-converting enzyme/putative endopeptidase